jgi:hypothetical protein
MTGLLDKKDAKHESDNDGPVHSPAGTGEAGHKVSKLEKIKDKLHIGHGKHD